jgi:MYXO-CTERM domain-containing protein
MDDACARRAFSSHSFQEARMALHLRRFILPVLLLGLFFAAPRLASAQTDSAVITTTTHTEQEDDDSDFPWGLLGLLGLAGLIPRRHKDVHVHEEVHTRPITPRDAPPPPRDPMPPHNPPRP